MNDVKRSTLATYVQQMKAAVQKGRDSTLTDFWNTARKRINLKFLLKSWLHFRFNWNHAILPPTHRGNFLYTNNVKQISVKTEA
jgi:hypothetical protein